MPIPRDRTPALELGVQIVDEKGRLTPAGLTMLRTLNSAIALLNGELPTYANNAAAAAAGLSAGRWYVTASGEVRIVV